MDFNQLISTGSDIYNSLDPEVRHSLTSPSAKTLGLAIDGLTTIVCYPLLKARIFTQGRLNQYQKEIATKINQIPEEKRDRSKLGLAIKAIEESRYQLNEDDVRRMYVNLIASTVNSQKNNFVNPRLAYVVAQFGLDEADLLKTIYLQRLFQMPFGYLTLTASQNRRRQFSRPIYIDDNDSILVNKDYSIDVLKSLGIINSHDGVALATKKYEKQYIEINQFFKTRISPTLHKDEEIELTKGFVKLTSFGENLCHCIFE